MPPTRKEFPGLPEIPQPPPPPTYTAPKTPDEVLAYLEGAKRRLEEEQARLMQGLSGPVPESLYGPLSQVAAEAMQPYYQPPTPSPGLALAMGQQGFQQYLQNAQAMYGSSFSPGATGISGKPGRASSPATYTPGVRSASDLWQNDIRRAMALKSVDRLADMDKSMRDLETLALKSAIMSEQGNAEFQNAIARAQYEAMLRGYGTGLGMMSDFYEKDLQSQLEEQKYKQQLGVIGAQKAATMAELERRAQLEREQHRNNIAEVVARSFGGQPVTDSSGNVTAVKSPDGVYEFPEGSPFDVVFYPSPMSKTASGTAGESGEKKEGVGYIMLQNGALLDPKAGHVIDPNTGTVSKAEDYSVSSAIGASLPPTFGQFVFEGGQANLMDVAALKSFTDSYKNALSKTPDAAMRSAAMVLSTYPIDSLKTIDEIIGQAAASPQTPEEMKSVYKSLLGLTRDAIKTKQAYAFATTTKLMNRVDPATGTAMTYEVKYGRDMSKALDQIAGSQEKQTPQSAVTGAGVEQPKKDTSVEVDQYDPEEIVSRIAKNPQLATQYAQTIGILAPPDDPNMDVIFAFPSAMFGVSNSGGKYVSEKALRDWVDKFQDDTPAKTAAMMIYQMAMDAKRAFYENIAKRESMKRRGAAYIPPLLSTGVPHP